MPISTQEVLEIVMRKGPLIPAVVAKELGIDLLFAQAYLSELSSGKRVRVSHVKVGGSPLYYVNGQEERLQVFSDRLNEKDKRAYDRLKEERVLRDKDLDPLTRFCLRQIKDFAVMVEVRVKDETQIFWKWYKCSNDEITPKVKQILGMKEGADQIKKKDVLQEEEPRQEPEKSPPEPERKPEERPAEPKKELLQEKQPARPQEDLRPPVQEKEPQKERQPAKPRQEGVQKKLAPDVEIETIDPLAQVKEAIGGGDEFLGVIVDFFMKNKIDVMNCQVVRKNSDAEFVVNIPTAVGPLDFFCKAKNKKKCNDGDLSSAFLQGQMKKLPVLFLTTGELTKKAEEMLSKEFSGMKVQRVNGSD